jgi:hypothetical protein
VLVIARPGIVAAEHRAIGVALRRLLAKGGVLGDPASEAGRG